jgi:hypothetical protein
MASEKMTLQFGILETKSDLEKQMISTHPIPVRALISMLLLKALPDSI